MSFNSRKYSSFLSTISLFSSFQDLKPASDTRVASISLLDLDLVLGLVSEPASDLIFFLILPASSVKVTWAAFNDGSIFFTYSSKTLWSIICFVSNMNVSTWSSLIFLRRIEFISLFSFSDNFSSYSLIRSWIDSFNDFRNKSSFSLEAISWELSSVEILLTSSISLSFWESFPFFEIFHIFLLNLQIHHGQ